jgi:mycothiol synthase
MYRIELRTVLDAKVLNEILELIEAATAIEGHRPVGEHKYSHLRVGAAGWVGVLAYEGERLVGYAHTRWNAEAGPEPPRPRMAVEVVVHPDYYGSDVARQLLLQARSVLARAGGGLLYLWVHRVEDAETTLARRLGFSIQRELAFMTRDLQQAPPPPTPPPGVELRPYRPDVDDDQFLRVNNAAFKGHPENGGWDVSELLDRRKRDWFDADGLIMAWRGRQCLGFHWTKWHGHDSDEVPAHEPVGEVYVLAVDPDAQGLGLGRVLLDAGLRYLHARECRLAVLYVDTASTTALRLYQRNGFELAYREVCYEDFVAPVVTHTGHDLSRPGY